MSTPHLMLSLPERRAKVAERIAREAHKNQVRKRSNVPYIIHPERVADNFEGDPIRRAVAWLHDVVEDTDWTIEQLEAEGFNSCIIQAIDRLTKKEDQTYLDFILGVKGLSVARDVKIADIKDNMSDLVEGPLKEKCRLALYILENIG